MTHEEIIEAITSERELDIWKLAAFLEKMMQPPTAEQAQMKAFTEWLQRQKLSDTPSGEREWTGTCGVPVSEYGVCGVMSCNKHKGERE